MKPSFSRRCLWQGINGDVCLIAVLLFLIVSGSNSYSFAQDANGHRRVLVKVQPKYPAFMTEGHYQGQVRLEATVLGNGNVSKVEVKGGSPIFARFAVEAAMKWKYAPAPNQTTEEIVFIFNSRNR